MITKSKISSIIRAFKKEYDSGNCGFGKVAELKEGDLYVNCYRLALDKKVWCYRLAYYERHLVGKDSSWRKIYDTLDDEAWYECHYTLGGCVDDVWDLLKQNGVVA